MGNSGCSSQGSQNPRSTTAESASPLPCTLTADVPEEEFNAHFHPPISAREGPGATPVTWNGLDLFRSRVFNYSKPGIQHHQRKGSGRSGQHPPGRSSRTWHLLQIFLGRSGGRKEGRDAENALIRPLNQSLSASPPERNTSATTVTSKCTGWL